LKTELKALQAEGHLERKGRRKLQNAERLPPVTVLEVSKITSDGDLFFKPVAEEFASLSATIELASYAKNKGLKLSSRILARLKPAGKDRYFATVMKVLESKASGRVYGVIEGNYLRPADRRQKQSFSIVKKNDLTVQDGDLVVAEVVEGRKSLGLSEVELVTFIGPATDVASISLLEALSKEIPIEFPEAVLAEADEAKPVSLGNRVDLRDKGLVTIDGSDAKDFDDAVFAQEDEAPENVGGFKLTVAIADVSWYVREGSALDREALKRGNSSYFPDRVFPMLPEALSNGLCSLVPNEERACLACDLTISNDGTLLKKHFYRGLMKSEARLTYETVQETADSNGAEGRGDLWESHLKPLYAAYHLLKKKRVERGALGIESQEFYVDLSDDKKTVQNMRPRERLTSHELIEEFMILANVAAAEVLEAKSALCMYRIHEPPDAAKVEGLRAMLETLDMKLPRSKLAPEHFNRILMQVEKSPHKDLVHESVLRSQSSAFYGPKNRGHFGLALNSYGHFTSPIRRYADLIVHRQLVHHLNQGEGDFNYDSIGNLTEIGEKISTTERRSVDAERASKDRYAAAYYSKHIGEIVDGRISSVTKFGLFVKLTATGADGLLPFSSLPDDRYDLSQNEQFVTGRRWGRIFSRGDLLKVKIIDADPILASLGFEFDSLISSVVPNDSKRIGGLSKPKVKPAKKGRRKRALSK